MSYPLVIRFDKDCDCEQCGDTYDRTVNLNTFRAMVQSYVEEHPDAEDDAQLLKVLNRRPNAVVMQNWEEVRLVYRHRYDVRLLPADDHNKSYFGYLSDKLTLLILNPPTAIDRMAGI